MQDVPIPDRSEGNMSLRCRLNTVDGNAFMYLSALNSNRAVCVNLDDRIGSFPSHFQFIRGGEMICHINGITNDVFVKGSSSIFLL